MGELGWLLLTLALTLGLALRYQPRQRAALIVLHSIGLILAVSFKQVVQPYYFLTPLVTYNLWFAVLDEGRRFKRGSAGNLPKSGRDGGDPPERRHV